MPGDGRGTRPLSRRRSAARSEGYGSDRGTVTAEFALVLPAVIVVLGASLAAVQISAQQVALQDAASAAARIVARGSGEAVARRTVASLVSGSTLRISSGGELVCVEVGSTRSVLSLPSIDLAARSCSPRSPE